MYTLAERGGFEPSISKDVAKSRGIPVRLTESIFMIVLGLISAATAPIVGALLCFSLLVVPTAASASITSNPKLVIALSLIFSVSSVWISLTLAYYSRWPIGFFVSTIKGIIYFLSRITNTRKLRNK